MQTPNAVCRSPFSGRIATGMNVVVSSLTRESESRPLCLFCRDFLLGSANAGTNSGEDGEVVESKGVGCREWRTDAVQLVSTETAQVYN
jgi:hypothetical protein